MGKILFFVPKPDDRKIVDGLFDSINDGEWELETRFVMGAKPFRPLKQDNLEADVIIARGVTAKAIKMLVKDLPLVDLSVTGYDIMDAVVECCERYNVRRIGLVGAQNMVFGAKNIERYMDVNIEPVAVNAEEEAELAIRELMSNGITAIIGGGMSTQIAKNLGMDTVFIHSGPEAIYQALREAIRVAKIRRIEQERSEQFRAILDYSIEGIVAVDKKGEINLANKAAIELAGLAEGVIGKSAEEVIPQLSLKAIVHSGKVDIGRFQTFGGQNMAVNYVPVKIKDQITGAVATFQPVSVIQELESEIRRRMHRKGLVAKSSFKDIFATSAIMQETVALAKEYSAVDSNVLIVGETGVGKEIFAQSLHNGSARKRGPFVPVNCAALPENLLESELFGYSEGAFTGALKGGKMGLFEQAHRGTLFLDEISEISPRIQGQLLRVLQEKEIRRLGDDKVIPVDVRVISATNRDLRGLVRDGKFRSDLYYRLDILKLNIPPLRERTDDILLMLRQFVEYYAKRFNRPARELSLEAQNRLKAYSWPGNVRELRNVAERLTVFSNYLTDVIQGSNIRAVLDEIGEDEKPVMGTPTKIGGVQALKKSQDLERIKMVLAQTNFNVGKTAEILGLSRTTMWRRIKLLGLDKS